LIEVSVDRIELPSGRRTDREVVHHPGAAAVVPFVSDGEVLLVRQYRHPVRTQLWEIPAGKLEPGEGALACARRELREETGFVADDWAEVGAFFTSPGFSDERITLFFAAALRPIGRSIGDEIVEHQAFKLDEVERMIDAGEITDAKTILAIARHLARTRGSG
jgi:ADP-ribose pyrophosphatase